MPDRPRLDVAVVMRRERLASRWQDYRWTPVEVVPDEPVFGDTPRLLRESELESHWLHPGLAVELFTDEAEGYWLNITTDTPSFFVLWRMADGSEDETLPRPLMLTLSYNEAGRWLDAQERVDPVPAPPEVVAWLRDFTEAHYVPEPKRRKRPESFRPLQDRFGNPVLISTEKGRRGGEGG